MIKIFGNKITSDKNFEEYDKNVIELSRNIAFKILESGADVIIDEGFWAKSERDGLKKKVSELGAKTNSLLCRVFCRGNEEKGCYPK